MLLRFCQRLCPYLSLLTLRKLCLAVWAVWMMGCLIIQYGRQNADCLLRRGISAATSPLGWVGWVEWVCCGLWGWANGLAEWPGGLWRCLGCRGRCLGFWVSGSRTSCGWPRERQAHTALRAAFTHGPERVSSCLVMHATPCHGTPQVTRVPHNTHPTPHAVRRPATTPC